MELMRNDDEELKQKLSDKSSGIYSKMTTYAFPRFYLDYFENYTVETTATIRGRYNLDIPKKVVTGFAREFYEFAGFSPRFQVKDGEGFDWVGFNEIEDRPVWGIRLYTREQLDYFLENFSRLTPD